MTTVELRFPARRYHGTPWGRHVNEGVPEWPPSPYRLLRAMYDAWQRKCAHLPEEKVRELMTTLGSAVPSFRIPRAVAAHTRSYLSSNTEDAADKSLIFDAFVAVAPDAACYIEWPVVLSAEQQGTLQELLEAMNYLGRSESWVEAALVKAAAPDLHSCVPAEVAGAKGELVYIASPVRPDEYSGKQRWFDALTYSTQDMLKQKRSIPPAMRNVPYVRDQGAVVTRLGSKPKTKAKRVSGLVLQISGRVLPLATEAVSIAEVVRGAVIAKIRTEVPDFIHGKDTNGKFLEKHQHLFVLPQSRNGRIDRVYLFSRGYCFEERELAAIRRLRELFPSEDRVYRCRVVVSWAGEHDSPAFRPKATAVVSTTPFITIRHWRRGRGEPLDFLKEEIRRECGNHGLPAPLRVEAEERIAGPFHAIEFRRHRKGEPSRPGYAFRIEFGEPVAAPFSLGYGCHFGLGQFDRA